MKAYLIVGVVVLLLGIVIGFPVGKSCAPKVRVGTETTTVQIVVHDTVTNYKDTGSISSIKKIVYVPKYVYVDSSKKTDTVQVADTSVCYSFDEVEKDGAYIKAEICSDSFPEKKPLDLRGVLTYKAPPDTIKHITRIDTVTRTNNVPFYKDWKTYAVGVLAAVLAGVLIAHR